LAQAEASGTISGQRADEVLGRYSNNLEGMVDYSQFGGQQEELPSYLLSGRTPVGGKREEDYL
jgi:hypothetical protein